MFACEWGKKKREIQTKRFTHIKKMSSMVWAEHCIECAVPFCYSNCDKYRKRKDGRCRLFADGINKIVDGGLSGYSAEITFEGWSKLEATYRPKQKSKWVIKTIDAVSTCFFSICKLLSNIFERKKTLWSITNFSYKVREFLSLLSNKAGKEPEVFLIDVFNPGDEVDIIVETKDVNNVFYYKNSFTIKPGQNTFFIPFDEIKIKTNDKSFVFITVSKDHKLIFNALDFVTFKKKYVLNLKTQFQHDKKIKCVAWDLDNTMWDGVLIEGDVYINNSIVSIIKSLDEKGIVNSIISKNDFSEAMNKLKQLGIDQYFVMPKINWLPKSVNISNLAKSMNIGLDSICFIDDNDFELAEVRSKYPEVLCINVNDVELLKTLDCFNVEVTEASKSRRLTYKMMETEHNELEKWSGTIDDFLRQCNIVAYVSRPKDNELARCHELLQRTNQLNASGRRLTNEELMNIYNSSSYKCFCIRCSDKFGDYGIVGFAIYSLIDNVITDFVISCRVANKTIEQTFIQQLLFKLNLDKISINYLKTNKNGPLFSIIKDLEMTISESNSITNVEKYTYHPENKTKQYDIVRMSWIE